MSLTVWANHELRTRARELFYDSLARMGCKLIQAEKSSRSVLTPGEPDPSMQQADIAYGQPDPADILRSPKLRWVALSTAGYTRYDTNEFRAAAQERRIAVTNASQVFAGPCAEHVLAMMLALNRELPKYVANQVGPREWNYLDGRYTTSLLAGATVVMLGYGAIGRRLTELLAPFRCRVIGVRRLPRGDEDTEIVSEADLASVLPLADHVVNLLPASTVTHHYCNAAFFRQMRHGAFFYNVGRGSTVDQDALIASLQSRWVGAAYLDALDPEPLPPSHPLWAEPRCHITPHTAGGQRMQDEVLVQHFLTNLGHFVKGEGLVDRII
ncbi:MAG TPA: D-2-hydroxyacid dehydrogenase [Candidatus Didemnitutus sp.]|nr:D-2-hydroxyacid dehydrogenase [Candidatus Didemnitutus sp.]